MLHISCFISVFWKFVNEHLLKDHMDLEETWGLHKTLTHLRDRNRDQIMIVQIL